MTFPDLVHFACICCRPQRSGAIVRPRAGSRNTTVTGPHIFHNTILPRRAEDMRVHHVDIVRFCVIVDAVPSVSVDFFALIQVDISYRFVSHIVHSSRNQQLSSCDNKKWLSISSVIAQM